MSEERYDLVIFGATGFTGQFVVEEVVRVQEELGGLTMAVAGRNMAKLQKVLEQASKQTGNLKFGAISFLVHIHQILEMCYLRQVERS